MMDKPDISLDELMERVPGPDFPTGGAIGRAGIRAAYASGRGSITMRAKVAVEELRKDREALIVSEIPYPDLSPTPKTSLPRPPAFAKKLFPVRSDRLGPALCRAAARRYGMPPSSA